MSKVIHIKGLCAITLIMAVWSLPGCGEKQQAQRTPATVTKGDVKKGTKEALSRTVNTYTKNQMETYRELAQDTPSDYGKDISYELTY